MDRALFELVAQGELLMSQLQQVQAEVDLAQLTAWQVSVQAYADALDEQSAGWQAKGQTLIDLSARMEAAYAHFAQSLQQQHAQSNMQHQAAQKYMANS